MTTKNRTTKTAAATANQAVEATPTEQAAQPVATQHEGQETPEQKVERLKKELADAKAVTKAVKTAKVKTPCAKAGCKLFAMEGRADNMCSNHRPEWDKLTEAEHEFVEKWVGNITSWELVGLLGAHGIRQRMNEETLTGK